MSTRNLTVNALPELSTESIGWFEGHRILFGQYKTRDSRGYSVDAPVFYFVPQNESSPEDREWEVSVTPIARAPAGVLAEMVCVKKGKGIFSFDQRHETMVHLQDDGICGASYGVPGVSANCEASGSKILAKTIAQMSPEQLQNLARQAMARAGALSKMAPLQESAEQSFESMMSNLAGSKT